MLNEPVAESRGEVIHGLASDDYYLPSVQWRCLVCSVAVRVSGDVRDCP